MTTTHAPISPTRSRVNSGGCPACEKPAISPSQIKLFRACQRKWAFRHVAKIPEPTATWQTLGLDVHKHNEDYLRHGVVPPKDTEAGAIAHVGLDILPLPSTKHLVESHVYTEVDGIAFHGWADLITTLPRLVVWDFKTTGNFNHALDSDGLKLDPQALIYAMALPNVPREPIDLRWLYYRTRKLYAVLPVKATLSPHELDENFATQVLEPARELVLARAVADPNHLPGNRNACDAYGGCPYRAKCTIKKDIKETFGMSLFRQTLGVPPATPARAVGVVPPDAPAPVLDPPPEAPKRRGRPPKIAAAAPAPKAEPLPPLPPTEPEVEAFTLCINALPVGGKPGDIRVQLLSDMVRPVATALAEQLGVTHYRLAKEAEYGRADALLLSAFAETKPRLAGIVYADRRDPDTAAVLPYVEAQAWRVFRGVL